MTDGPIGHGSAEYPSSLDIEAVVDTGVDAREPSLRDQAVEIGGVSRKEVHEHARRRRRYAGEPRWIRRVIGQWNDEADQRLRLRRADYKVVVLRLKAGELRIEFRRVHKCEHMPWPRARSIPLGRCNPRLPDPSTRTA